jgi:Fe-S cluster assembly protein SufD
VADQAKAVFNGRIHIHPQAQKTLAMLSNKNLLTSNKAEVDTKPELEIYADDVQCAHGATVAQLEAESLHYLMTRGISRKEAEVMLSFGFINEIIDKVKHDAISQYLRPIMAGLFARDPELMRHLV